MNTVTRQVDFPDTSEEAIAEYLKSHPDFFERHLTLLSGLRLPHRTTGGAISLVERQVDMLRQRNHAMETKLRELIDVARTNDRLAGRIHSLALLLMRAKSREEVVDILDEQLREGFSVDQAALVLFDSVPGLAQGHTTFVRVVHREDPSVGPFKSFMQNSSPCCELLAVVCVLTMLASTAPIFAAGSTNTVVLTSEQQAKLDTMQSQLTDLVAKIQSLKITYKDTKAKGLLQALTQFEKQAKRLNTTITNYEKQPTASANRKIRTFQFKTKQLHWKVSVIEKNLKKTKKVKKVKKVRKNCSK